MNEIRSIYTLKQLSFLLGVPTEIIEMISVDSPKLYTPFDIPKNIFSVRTIDNPHRKLKALQSKILTKILNTYQLPNQIMGGRKGIGIKDYLKVHTNQPEVVSLDIKNCFPSTTHEQVHAVFREQFNCSRKVSSILTKLTTYRGRLPQGAPSSNMLLNIVLTPACKQIAVICEAHNCRVSFWVDDITVSGLHPSILIQEIIGVIQKNGYAVRANKIKVMKQSQRQLVLNHVVNKKVSVSKSKYDEYVKRYFGSMRRDEIDGIINHLQYINPKQARRLKNWFIIRPT